LLPAVSKQIKECSSVADDTMTDIMKTVARETGVEHEDDFSQLVVLDLAICTGLAALWLHQLEKGHGATFFQDVAAKPDLRFKAEDWYERQNEAAKPWIAKGHLQPTTPKAATDETKVENFNLEIFFRGGNRDTLHAYDTEFADAKARNAVPFPQIANATGKFQINTDKMMGLVGYLNRTHAKRRFFLIDTQQSGDHPGHTMGAAKNRFGRIRFFDPNAGVVGTWSAGKMERFLRQYFSTRKVYWAYRRRSNDVLELKVRKYKPA
jgi:hypothetical protein